MYPMSSHADEPEMNSLTKGVETNLYVRYCVQLCLYSCRALYTLNYEHGLSSMEIPSHASALNHQPYRHF